MSEDIKTLSSIQVIMLLTIPYQAFEIGNVHLAPFQYNKYGKPIACLSYKDASIDFQDISILTPPLLVHDYFPQHMRLRLNVGDQAPFHSKMNTLYEYLVSTFYVHQQGFLNQQGLPIEAIHHMFYPLLERTLLSVYVTPHTTVKMPDGMGKPVTELKPGDRIRCVIRIQGISQLMNKDGFHLRIHHSVPSIWALKA